MLKLWSYDLAREQAPRLDDLFTLAETSLEAGYDGIALYLEHRFAYPSAPWAAGQGALTSAMVARLRAEYPSLRVVPMINLLGHMEGFLRCREGERFSALRGRGMEPDLRHVDLLPLLHGLLDDVLAAFDDEIIHLGGDETQAAPKAYCEHFGPLCERVLAAGRRPALWGDVILAHPEAAAVPRETLIFDWQYFGGLRESSPRLTELGFDVFGCPSLQCYNAPWMHVRESAANVEAVAADAHALDLAGTCLATWEMGLIGAYDTLLPAIGWAANPTGGAEGMLAAYGPAARWAELLGCALPALGEPFAQSPHRSRLRVRMLLHGDPFLAWREHSHELIEPSSHGRPVGSEEAIALGAEAIALCEQALRAAPGEAEQGIAVALRGIVEFVLMVQAAAERYDAGQVEACVALLASTRMIFDQLALVARRSAERFGGSRADLERIAAARARVEQVIVRVRRYGDGALGYVPSFFQLTEPRFMPHDQAAWWRVNDWA